MTKQHFEAFARYINAQKQVLHESQSLVIRAEMAKMVADVAKQFNGRFDSERFFRACGLIEVK